jgi:hypothetical protein
MEGGGRVVMAGRSSAGEVGYAELVSFSSRSQTSVSRAASGVDRGGVCLDVYILESSVFKKGMKFEVQQRRVVYCLLLP